MCIYHIFLHACVLRTVHIYIVLCLSEVTHCLLQTLFIGIPLCPNGVDLVHSTIWNNDCDVSLTWQQPPNTPVTSTTVTYCPTSSPNCGNSVNCTSPCTISGLDPGTEYQFTVIPNNNCGSSAGCTGNTATHSEWILYVCICLT